MNDQEKLSLPSELPKDLRAKKSSGDIGRLQLIARIQIFKDLRLHIPGLIDPRIERKQALCELQLASSEGLIPRR